MTQPRILIITRNLPPLVGGMERLNWHMADELSKYAEVKLIGPSDAENTKPQNASFHGVPLKPLWRFLLQGLWQAIRQARVWKPDIILAGSGLTAPLALIAASLSGAKAAVYIHGLDITVQQPVYQALWLPAIRRMQTVIVNSTPTRALTLDANVSLERISIVPPGVSLPTQSIGAPAKQAFLHQYNLQGKDILLSVGRLTSRKGLREFVQNALPRIVQARSNAMLVIIGDAPNHALSAEVQTPKSLLDAAHKAGVSQHIKLLGVVSEAELNTAFGCAALHIFPIRYIPGDPEGFGMVAIEAAAHGIPTVAFATGGVVDAVSHGNSGLLVAPGDYPGLAQAAIQVLESQPADWSDDAVAFAKRFAWPAFGKQVYDVLQRSTSLTSS